MWFCSGNVMDMGYSKIITPYKSFMRLKSMNQAAVDILIFAGIAIFLFFKLRNVLGEVDESDKEKSKTTLKAVDKTEKQSGSNDRLVKLSAKNAPGEFPSTFPDFKLVSNATVHNNLLHIHSTAPQFDPYHFLEGARRAFPMIIEAFSKGDKATLKKLLSEDLFTLYQDVIDGRQKNGETWDSDIVELNNVIISDADIKSGIAKITVDYEAVEKVTARDAQGEFIDDQKGDPEKTQSQWVFSKDIKAKNHIWSLVETNPIGDE